MSEEIKNNNKLWQSVILIAGIFAVLISILVIANYFQLNRFDPVNTEIINSLVDKLNENPNDTELRDQIREVDLLARKAYFTNQWQVKTGGYLLLIAIAVIVISFQIIDLNKRKQVTPNPDSNLDFFGLQSKAIKGVIIAGSIVFVFAGVLTILTSNQLNNRFAQTLVDEEVVEPEGKSEDKIEEVEIAEAVSEEQKKEDNFEAETDKGEKDSPLKTEVPQKEIAEKPEPKKQENKPVKTSKSTNPSKTNFTSFRGYGGLGIVHNKNIPLSWDGPSGENILWKVSIPVHGYNSPIIWEDKLFLSGANDNIKEVYCYARATGKLLWQKAITGIEGSPAKAPKTTADTGLAASTMVTDGTNVYVIFATGDVVALNMKGDIVWGKNLGVPQNHYGHSSSLYIFKDKLIVQYDHKGSAKLLALNSKTGETVWSTTRNVKVSWASPIIINQETNPEIILVADPYVASYNPETGAENWKLDCIYGEVGPSAAYDNGIIYALNEYATLAAIKLGKEPELIWEGDMYLSDVPSPVAANGLLFIATSYGSIVMHNGETGDIIWEQEVGNNVYASPMLVGDNIYLLDMEGNMHIIKMAKTYEKVATLKLGEKSVCTPAFADGKIYIRAGNNLYAIGK